MEMPTDFMRLMRKGLREVAPFAFKRFTTSDRYWQTRYRYGGNSGKGSRGMAATEKAAFVNRLCRQHGITSIIDVGCGDGHVAQGYEVDRYLGLDISPAAIELAAAANKSRPGRQFHPIDGMTPEAIAKLADANSPRPRLALSLDVMFHLVEDDTFSHYLAVLDSIPADWLLVQAPDVDGVAAGHVRDRAYSGRLAPHWSLMERLHAPDRCLFKRA